SSLLTRTKDPRAIPLLIRQFQGKKTNRSTEISVLSQIGDQTVVDLLVAEYPKMNNQDKQNVMQGLLQLHAPEFVQLAEDALLIKDSSLVRLAANGLYQEGSDRAEKILIDSLKKEAKHPYWSYICNELMNFGTSEARDALRLARTSKDSNKKSAAINALRNMQQRSPGNQYIYQANNFVKQEKWDFALRYYNLALEADPDYATAYAGRGNIYIRQKKYKEAKSDFDHAVKADPENNQAHAGVAILKILDGQIDEGVKYMQTARKQFEPYESNKSMMSYNIACVYGRAVEELSKKTEGAKDDKKKEEYESQAITELQAAVKFGFNDFELMKKDPDLQAVAKSEEFQKLLPKPNKDRKRPNLDATQQIEGGGGGFF
ncbi:MAG: tetratricopeptide repeat protein, partial [Planctomycetaceae bacterium]|nr:tetratricopeptide repeat protein [Planctomycetaceae bacterium]